MKAKKKMASKQEPKFPLTALALKTVYHTKHTVKNIDNNITHILLRVVDALHEHTGDIEPWKSIRDDIAKLQ